MNVREERDGDHAAVDALQRAAFVTHPDQVADLVEKGAVSPKRSRPIEIGTFFTAHS